MKKTKKLSAFMCIVLVLNLFLTNAAFYVPKAQANGDFNHYLVFHDDYEEMFSRSDLESAGYTIIPATSEDNDVTVIDSSEISNTHINNPNTGNVLYVKDKSNSTTTRFTRSLPEQLNGIITVEFDWRSDDQGANTQGYRLMRVENSSGEGLVEIRISDSGRHISQNVSGSNKRLVSDFTKDTWYYFRIELNTDTQRAEVFVRAEGQSDFSSAGQWGYHQSISSNEVKQLSSYSQSSLTSSYYIDNLRVYTSVLRPQAPGGLTAFSGDGEVVLTWDPVPGVTEYKIKQADVSGGPYSEIAAGVTEATFLDANVENDRTYYYVVVSSRDGLDSVISAEVNATPQIPSAPVAPTNVEVNPGNGQVMLQWDPVGNAELYNVKRSGQSEGPYTIVTTTTATRYVDTGLLNDSTYYYVISARNSIGESEDSIEVSATPLETHVNPSDFDIAGYATLNGGTTGGAGGDVVYINNGRDLEDILRAKIKNPTPLTIYINGTITPENTGSSKLNVKDVSDVSIIGVGTQGEFDRIGFTVSRANNIIFRNLSIHHVRGGEGTAIEVTENSRNIWIDHNEFFSDRDHGINYYDGLVDIKRGAEYVTVSWNKFMDHYKVSLNGHTDNPSLAPDKITYHHNYFYNVNSRTPLIRYADVHMYNNYFKDISDTAINSRNGARVLVENNYFENVGSGEVDPVTGYIKGPVGWFYGSPTTGYWNLSGNTFVNSPADHLYSTTDFTVPYQYSLHSAEEAKLLVEEFAGVGIIDYTDPGTGEPGDGSEPDPTDPPGDGGNDPGDGDSEPGDGTDGDLVLVDENFNSVAIGSQPEGFVFTGDIGSVVEVNGREGKVLLLPASSNTNGFTKEFTPQHELVVAELDFMQPTRSNSAYVLALADSSGNDVIRIETRDHHFKSRLADGSYHDSNVENTNGSWKNIKVIADISEQTLNLYIDNNQVMENVPFFRNATEIAQIKSSTPGSSVREHYVDNVKVYVPGEDLPPGDGGTDPGDGDGGTDPGEGSGPDPGDDGNSGGTLPGEEMTDTNFDRSQSYIFINKYSGKVLDIAGASYVDNTSIIQNTQNGLTTQLWKVEQISSGHFHIFNRYSDKLPQPMGRSKTAGTDIVQVKNGSSASHAWAVEHLGNGDFKLINKNNNLALEVEGFSEQDGGNVVQNPFTGEDNQLWKIAVAEGAPQQSDFSLVGFATYGEGTTGGAGGEIVTVSTAEDFIYYIERQEPYIIQVSGTIDLPDNPNSANPTNRMYFVESNKTIIGLGSDAGIRYGGLNLRSVSNIIIRNLTFSEAKDDSINLEHGTTHVWVDHNNFTNGYDGLVDIKRESNYVTVSWNKFYNHDKVSLVGHDDKHTADRGLLKVTYHHNWFSDLGQRNPRVRYGSVHLYNNYYNNVSEYAFGVGVEATLISENNFIEDANYGPKYYDTSSQPGYFKDTNSIFSGLSHVLATKDSGITWSPNDYYSYIVDDTLSVRDIVKNGAGVGIIDTTGGGDNGTPPDNNEPVEPTVPNAPKNVQAIAGNQLVTLSWDSVTSASSYVVKRAQESSEDFVVIATVATTSFIDSGLENGIMYHYTIQAVNNVGNSIDSTQVSAVPFLAAPQAPTGVSADAGDRQVTISWNSVDGADTYKVLRSNVLEDFYVSVAENVSESRYEDKELAEGRMYYYQVIAVNVAGESPASQIVSALTPRGLSSGDGNDYSIEVDINGLELLIDDHFNDLTTSVPEGYSVSDAGGTVHVVNVPSFSNKSVLLADTSSSDHVRLSKEVPVQKDRLAIQMQFMQPEKDNATKILRLTSSEITSGVGAAVILETVDGHISYRNSNDSFTALVANYQSNRWYSITVDANVKTQTADVYIDGDLMISNAPFHTNVTRIDGFDSFTANSKKADHYVDNIRVYGISSTLETINLLADSTTLTLGEELTVSFSGVMSDGAEADLQNAAILYGTSHPHIVQISSDGMIQITGEIGDVREFEVWVDVMLEDISLRSNIVTIDINTLELVQLTVDVESVVIGEPIHLLLSGEMSNEAIADLSKATIVYGSSHPHLIYRNSEGTIRIMGEVGLVREIDVWAEVVLYNQVVMSNVLTLRITPTISLLELMVTGYALENDISPSLEKTILTILQKARQYYNAGNSNKATKELENVVKELNKKSSDKSITPAAKEHIINETEELMTIWKK
ncbi:fibronectin type III domain-containing protein [Evansella sp. AB-rgal1]|uniref:pectate lyase family protein n=1 Tax=Evansella sp. AB-rgal1 TaxID=3242696 RepID=UPI00359E3FDF